MRDTRKANEIKAMAPTPRNATVDTLEGVQVADYDCAGCGAGFNGRPPRTCPHCGSHSFSRNRIAAALKPLQSPYSAGGRDAAKAPSKLFQRRGRR